MENVKINDNDLNAARGWANGIETVLSRTYDQSGVLLTYVNSSKWSGKSRDACLTYLEILNQYHKELLETSKLQTKALNNLKGYMDDFLQDGSVKEVKNL